MEKYNIDNEQLRNIDIRREFGALTTKSRLLYCNLETGHSCWETMPFAYLNNNEQMETGIGELGAYLKNLATSDTKIVNKMAIRGEGLGEVWKFNAFVKIWASEVKHHDYYTKI